MPAARLPFLPPFPVQPDASLSETSGLRWLAGRQEPTTVGLKSVSHFKTAHSGALSTCTTGAKHVMEPKRLPPSVASEPMTSGGGQSAASVFDQFSTGQTVNISTEAAHFAQEHTLWGSLVVIKTLVSRSGSPVVAVDVDLIPDPDVKGTPVICFALRSNASLPDLVDYDERLRGLVCDKVPAGDLPYFAIRFDLE